MQFLTGLKPGESVTARAGHGGSYSDWQSIDTAPRGNTIRLKGPAYETRGTYDQERGRWCGTEAPHFMLPFGPASQPTHWMPV